MKELSLSESDPYGGCRQIAVDGAVDIAVVDRLEAAINRASDHELVLVDLRACDFLDSLALTVLLRAQQNRSRDGRRIALFGANSKVRRVLDLVGLVDNGLVFETAEEAAEVGA